jgi:hypothetical protein
MSANKVEPLKFITVITDRAKGKKVTELLNENGCILHDSFLGRGTAPTELSSILGLGEREKAVTVLLAVESAAAKIFAILNAALKELGGIAFSTPLSSIGSLKTIELLSDLNSAVKADGKSKEEND